MRIGPFFHALQLEKAMVPLQIDIQIIQETVRLMGDYL